MFSKIKFLPQFRLEIRLSILIGVLLIVIFTIFGVYIYQSQKIRIKADADERMLNHLNDIVSVLEIGMNEKESQLNTALSTAHYLFENAGKFYISDTAILQFSATNELTRATYKVSVEKWFFNNKQIQSNFDIVDKIFEVAGARITIFQKMSKGYLRISSNLYNVDDSRAIGTYIPNSSEIIRAVEGGDVYKDRIYFVDRWYLMAYKEIKVQGITKGMIGVAVEEKNYEMIKSIFDSKRYFTSGYPFMIDKNGTYIIHPTDEGENVAWSFSFKQRQGKEEGNFRYLMNDSGPEIWKWQYFKYFDDYEAFVAVSLYEEDIFKPLTQINTIIVVGLIISVLIILLGVYLIIAPIIQAIRRYIEIFAKMSVGEMVPPLPDNRTDELGRIIKSINNLIQGLSKKSYFAHQIAKGNLETEFESESEKDELGSALIEMRTSLKISKEDERKRKLEDYKLDWATDGQNKFAEIMRKNNDNLEILGDEIIKNLVHYLNANQGGLYILNDENSDNIVLEMLAAYAYDRKKHIDKTIPIGMGLIGTCAVERKTMLLTEIPPNYAFITSGLGASIPSSLLIVPLIFNEEVLGIIELASFNEFKDFEVAFVESLAESIASVLSTVRINSKTAILLAQSQEQHEAMQQQEEEMVKSITELQMQLEGCEHYVQDLKTQVEKQKRIIDKFVEEQENETDK